MSDQVLQRRDGPVLTLTLNRPEKKNPLTLDSDAELRAVLAEAGRTADDIASMTWYVTDMVACRGAGPVLGRVWRGLMGRHYPCMAVVGVSSLVEPLACVEIEALTILPPPKESPA